MKDWFLDRWDELVCLTVNTRDGIWWWLFMVRIRTCRWLVVGLVGLFPMVVVGIEDELEEMQQQVDEIEQAYAGWKQS